MPSAPTESDVRTNRIEAELLFAHGPAARVWREGDALAVFSGVPFPFYNAARPPRGEAASARPWLSKCVAEYRQAGLPAVVLIEPESGASLGPDDFAAHGLKRIGGTRQIAVDTYAVDYAELGRAGMRLVRVLDSSQLLRWCEVEYAAFEIPPHAQDHYARVFTSALKTDSHRLLNYVAYLDGRAVGAFSLLLTPGLAGVYNIAIHPDRRSRKLGSALLLLVLDKARSLGYRYSAGAAMEEVLPFYRNLPQIPLGSTDVYLVGPA